MLNIYVTKDDIEQGETDSCRKCPVALAVNRRLKRGCFAVVGGTFIDVYNPPGYETVKLPAKVTAFIRNFDAQNLVKPFRFELELT
jgi:hypothetical protein